MAFENHTSLPSKSGGLLYKNPTSIDDMWKSLLVPNIDLDKLETYNGDTALQGMSILVETTFFHIKDVCFKLRKTEKELEKVRQDWQTSVQSCEELRQSLKNVKTSCKNCAKLQADLSAANARSDSLSSVLIAALKTLNPPNGSKPQSESQTKKACNLMTQALQGTQDFVPPNENLTEESPLSDIWRFAKQKRSLEDVSSPNEILGTPENQHVSKRPFKLSVPSECDSLKSAATTSETLNNVKNASASPGPVKKLDSDVDERKILCDVSMNLPTTPKKGVAKPKGGSPILGNSYKKTVKGGTPVWGNNSPTEIFGDSPRVSRNLQDSQELPSPSLLHSEKSPLCKQLGVKGPLAAVKSTASSGSSKAVDKVLALDPANHDVSFERRQGGTKKVKQAKLSLSFFQRPKQDISTLKEFNGGVRAQASDLGVELLDEDRQLERALHESLLEEKRRKKENRAVLGIDSYDATFWDPVSNDGDGDGDGDDVIAPTPQKNAKRQETVVVTEPRAIAETLTSSFQPVITSTMMKSGCSMNAFAPNFFSTAKILPDETCTPNYNLEALVEEMANDDDDTMCSPKCIETSFDRLPRREKTSPNYKYKRDPVRKKSERQKIHGFGCPCCANFLEGNGVDPNKVSRHRDHNGPLPSTPEGYWNPSFPHSLLGKR